MLLRESMRSSISACGRYVSESDPRPNLSSLVLVLTSLSDGQDWSETIAPEKREAYEVYEVNVEEDLDSVLEKQGFKAEDIKVIVISRASRTSSSPGIDNLNDTTLTRLRTRFGSAALRPPL
jgi:hypothetical protein